MIGSGPVTRIRELREGRGLTMAELARLLAVSESTVYRWEAGDSVPQKHIRTKLARRLGVGVEELGLEGGTNEESGSTGGGPHR